MQPSSTKAKRRPLFWSFTVNVFFVFFVLFVAIYCFDGNLFQNTVVTWPVCLCIHSLGQFPIIMSLCMHPWPHRQLRNSVCLCIYGLVRAAIYMPVNPCIHGLAWAARACQYGIHGLGQLQYVSVASAAVHMASGSYSSLYACAYIDVPVDPWPQAACAFMPAPSTLILLL